jgi:hypothetical protein
MARRMTGIDYRPANAYGDNWNDALCLNSLPPQSFLGAFFRDGALGSAEFQRLARA